MQFSLTNTQKGIIVLSATTAVAANRFVQLVDDTGTAKVQYPTADGQVCQYVTLEATTAAGPVAVAPISSYYSLRVNCLSTIAGAVQIMCENATGNMKALSGAGSFCLGTTEEDVISGQIGRIRPSIFVVKPTGFAGTSWAQTQTALTDSTGGSVSTTLAAITTFTPSVAWNGSSVYPSAADATAIAAAITSEKNSIASLAAELALIKTDVGALRTILIAEGITS